MPVEPPRLRAFKAACKTPPPLAICSCCNCWAVNVVVPKVLVTPPPVRLTYKQIWNKNMFKASQILLSRVTICNLTCAWPVPIFTVWIVPEVCVGRAAVVMIWCEDWVWPAKAVLTARVPAPPWVVSGVVLTGRTMLCCWGWAGWPAWMCTRGCCCCWRCCWMIGRREVTEAGACALMTVVRPVNLVGVPGADWEALIYCWGWVAFSASKLAKDWGGREALFIKVGFVGLFFCRHSNQEATWKSNPN